MYNTAKVEKGATAAVFGIGAVGLACIEALVAAEASRIIAVDTNPEKEAAAREWGATDFVNPKVHYSTSIYLSLKVYCYTEEVAKGKRGKPLKGQSTIDLEASTIIRIAQQHHHESLPSTFSNTLIVATEQDTTP